MEEVLIFGHKSPDTDTICSALVLANLRTKLGDTVKACRLGEPNKETKFALNYLNVEVPELISGVEENQEVILVDHNEYTQSVKGIETAELLEVIDHHRVCDIFTARPISFRNEIIGSTCSIIAKMYREAGIQPEKSTAALMCCAIISDTMNFNSPTTTPVDRVIAEGLAKWAGIDLDEIAKEMFGAVATLKGRSVSEILYNDFKEYTEFFNTECIWSGGKEVASSNLTVGTFQSLIKYIEKDSSKYNPKFFEKFDCVFVDEVHRAKASQIKNIISQPFMKDVKVAFGMTGTIPKEKTIDFYVKKLGFKILRENHRQDRADIKLDLQFGDQELEIFVNPSAPKRPNYPEALGLRHLAFKVKDIDEAVAWLNERGIETEPIRFDVFTQNRMTFFKDPDGLPLEIHE